MRLPTFATNLLNARLNLNLKHLKAGIFPSLDAFHVPFGSRHLAGLPFIAGSTGSARSYSMLSIPLRTSLKPSPIPSPVPCSPFSMSTSDIVDVILLKRYRRRTVRGRKPSTAHCGIFVNQTAMRVHRWRASNIVNYGKLPR